MISGEAAWRSAAKNSSSGWHDVAGDLLDAVVNVAHQPKFQLSADETYFCMGSCFARNIEEHLMYRGTPVLSKNIISPRSEWAFRPNGLVNKFTTHSMRTELEWLLARPEIDETLFVEVEGGWADLQLCPGALPVSLDRAVERRQYLTGVYFDRIRQASVIVLTLGLNEVWFDSAKQVYLNTAPSYFSVRRNPGRYLLKMTDVADNLAELERIFEIIRLVNGRSKVIVTVSPVPMNTTFSRRDVIVANTLSKSVLRAAAEMFAAAHEDVDYFPSYEMIAMAPREKAYIADCLHVTDEAVGAVMHKFLHLYLEEVPEAVPFREMAYLNANPDVDALVRRGELDSGFQHWIAHGRAEGRPLAPADA